MLSFALLSVIHPTFVFLYTVYTLYTQQHYQHDLLCTPCVQMCTLSIKYTPCALQPASGYILSGCTAPCAVRFSILHNSMKYCSAWLQFGECICFFNFE